VKLFYAAPAKESPPRRGALPTHNACLLLLLHACTWSAKERIHDSRTGRQFSKTLLLLPCSSPELGFKAAFYANLISVSRASIFYGH